MFDDRVTIKRVDGVWTAYGTGITRPILVEGDSIGDVALRWYDIREKQKLEAQEYADGEQGFDNTGLSYEDASHGC